jgi:hypothetical protein
MTVGEPHLASHTDKAVTNGYETYGFSANVTALPTIQKGNPISVEIAPGLVEVIVEVAVAGTAVAAAALFKRLFAPIRGALSCPAKNSPVSSVHVQRIFHWFTKQQCIQIVL